MDMLYDVGGRCNGGGDILCNGIADEMCNEYHHDVYGSCLMICATIVSVSCVIGHDNYYATAPGII